MNATLELILAVKENQGISAESLAQMFGVSDRTVRNRIKAANSALADAGCIECRRTSEGHGYVLEVVDDKAFELLQRRFAMSEALPQGSRERTAYLANDLLSRNDWVTLDVLADVLCVSRASISADLKQVEELLAKHDLSLERRPRYGVKVAGPELKRRGCLAALARKNAAATGSSFNLAERLNLKTVTECVEEALGPQGFIAELPTGQSIIVHVAISVLRSQGGNPPQFDGETIEQVSKLGEYQTAKVVAESVQRTFGVELPPAEVAYLAIHLAGRQAVEELDAASGNVRADCAPDHSEAWWIVQKMLDAVWETFHFELRDDLELRANLARHIAPLLLRLRYNISVDNPLLGEIKASYPFAYMMAAEASGVLSSEYSSNLSDDEIGYIALSFALALERRSSSRPKKNVLVVCGTGKTSARLLATKLEREFGSYLGSVEVCEVGGLRSRDLSSVDYVFTTVPIPFELKVPQLPISLIIDEDEHASIAQALVQAHRNSEIRGFFDPRLFFAHVGISDKDEVLRYLCERIREVEDVDADFEELVFERESLAFTAFGGPIALPHPLRPASERTFVSVALLDRPVPWNESLVSAVFLISNSHDAGEETQALFESLSSFWLSQKSIERLLEERTLETLLEELKGGASE